MWLLAPDAMQQAPDAIATEGALVIEYMATYGISGDGLGLGTGPLRRVTVATDDLAAALPTAEVDTPPATAVVDATSQLGAHIDDHTAVIVITSDASSWQRALDAASVSGDQPTSDTAPTDHRAATRSTHVIELRPGAPRTSPTPSDRTTPVSSVDPTVPGELAASLARAWVEAYGGGWRDEPTP